MKFNDKLFSTHIKERLVVDKKNEISISLRNAAKQNGLSVATMSRLVNQSLPDVISFAIVCKWMGKPMELYFKPKK